ncbi:MAG: Na+/H+ antiporter NhaA [Candidatus Altimarinota bacterium]
MGRLDDRFPLIVMGLVLGALAFTVGENTGLHAHHVLHHKAVHFVANDIALWFFFAYLGLEISLSSVLKAGKFVGLATVGGMVVPPLFAYLLTGNPYLAAGACATDVAFSIGASNLLRGADKLAFTLLVSSLMILAVGDDLGGVMVLAGIYANNMAHGWVIAALLILAFSYLFGERGVVTLYYELNDGGKREKIDLIIQVRSILLWVLFGALNTYILWLAGIEWVLGGCLVFIFAPESVKHDLGHGLKQFIPLILFAFGLVNGAINTLDPKIWGLVTLGAMIGGAGGKFIGISAGAWLGRLWERKTSNGVYAHAPLSQICSLGLFAATNGTVAIVFVSMAQSKGKITADLAAQGKLGYLLTVPLVYLVAAVVAKMGIVKDVPEFMPSQTPEPDPLMADNPVA